MKSPAEEIVKAAYAKLGNAPPGTVTESNSDFEAMFGAPKRTEDLEDEADLSEGDQYIVYDGAAGPSIAIDVSGNQFPIEPPPIKGVHIPDWRYAAWIATIECSSEPDLLEITRDIVRGKE